MGIHSPRLNLRCNGPHTICSPSVSSLVLRPQHSFYSNFPDNSYGPTLRKKSKFCPVSEIPGEHDEDSHVYDEKEPQKFAQRLHYTFPNKSTSEAHKHNGHLTV
jgi:hypothetical protein